MYPPIPRYSLRPGGIFMTREIFCSADTCADRTPRRTGRAAVPA